MSSFVAVTARTSIVSNASTVVRRGKRGTVTVLNLRFFAFAGFAAASLAPFFAGFASGSTSTSTSWNSYFLMRFSR